MTSRRPTPGPDRRPAPATPRADARPAEPKPVPAELREGDSRITVTSLVGSGSPDMIIPPPR